MLKILGLSRKKILKGGKLIEDVVGKFSNMIVQLDNAVEDCRADRIEIEIKMCALSAKDKTLVKNIDEGTNLSHKLSDLIG